MLAVINEVVATEGVVPHRRLKRDRGVVECKYVVEPVILDPHLAGRRVYLGADLVVDEAVSLDHRGVDVL